MQIQSTETQIPLDHIVYQAYKLLNMLDYGNM